MKGIDRLHFVGIGGAGMSAIAAVMKGRGAIVCGSDQKESQTTRRLASAGVHVDIGHRRENLCDVDLVVVSAAIPDDNPEVLAAREKGIPVIQRAEMLGRLMSAYRKRIAIAGTHGKTTTTSMTSLVLLEARLDPTILVGGDVDIISGNARLGEGDFFLTEACEAFSSFLHLRPSTAVVTNIDADHLDHHGSLDNIKDVFRQFLGQVDSDGCIIACGDDENVRETLAWKGARAITYGMSSTVDVRAEDVDIDTPSASYSLIYSEKRLGRVSLAVPGVQNVMNSLAAAIVGMEHGVHFDTVRCALSKYRGVGRRFEMLGEAEGVMVVDDYAHHPAEIAATLAAAKRGWKRRVIAIFQPHLYSRTKFFLQDFAKSLSLADRVIITDIYAAREQPIPGVNAEQIVNAMNSNGIMHAEYIADKTRIASHILPYLKAGDMALVMGAGDIRVVGEEIFSRLSGRAPSSDTLEKMVK